MTKAGSMRLSARTKAPSSNVSSNMVAACVRSVLFMSFQDFKASGRRRLSTVSTMACVQIKKEKEKKYLRNSGKNNLYHTIVTKISYIKTVKWNENAVLKWHICQELKWMWRGETKETRNTFLFYIFNKNNYRYLLHIKEIFFWNCIDHEGKTAGGKTNRNITGECRFSFFFKDTASGQTLRVNVLSLLGLSDNRIWKNSLTKAPKAVLN